MMNTDQFTELDIYNANFATLDQKGKILAEYVWLGGAETVRGGFDMRSKTMTLDKKPSSVSELKIWNYDGSSTNQAPGTDSEVLIKPVAIFPDPFRKGDNILVLCEALEPVGHKPIPTNTRADAKAAFDKDLTSEPWFGIEQEYAILQKDNTPVGWPKGGYPGPQGPYYCSAGADNSYARPLVEAHYKACLYAGVKLAGINGEVMPGQWEYQVGPCVGIESGDHVWISRYILVRVAEMFGLVISFDPKPMPGDWNGSGAHTNYSTAPMRKAGGYAVIKDAIDKLGKVHMEHIEEYGTGNERRLSGLHETAPIDKFSWGVANRGCSIRIPRDTDKQGFGYFEDRRPASNCDPYVVTSRIFKTTVLNETKPKSKL